ncbi:MAG TPA: glycine cleavage system aminomethyltransferase GcvT [Candidatus Dormibacteraeota bacterium]|nr:glycine cleavage system aminomethyltransferase GcvT [Candidatus Dormibacteraeota bacterium]
MTTTSQTVLRTPLYQRHVDAGAQMVEFGGWMMPLQYTSMRDEHQAVRQDVGVFDVSHMGEVHLTGPGALDALERVVTNRLGDMSFGQARYTLICNRDGGIIDDALVYRPVPDVFTVVVNAGPRPVDVVHLGAEIGGACEMRDITEDLALIAVQGPRALEILQPLTDTDLSSIAYYHFQEGSLGGTRVSFSRTGYTGEDGFELFVDSGDAIGTWDAVVAAGARPCGLGARDTLRLEAAMRLSGQDIDTTTNPLEAGLGWAVKLDKGAFLGRDALLKVKEEGPARAFIGLELEGRAIARHGYAIKDGGRDVGEVTSGTFSFTLGKAVAMGYVERGSAESSALTVDVRGEPVAAIRVPLPFYKRERS